MHEFAKYVALVTTVTLLAFSVPINASGEVAAQDSGPSDDYRIGARDLLEIRVFGLDELDSDVRVSEVGTISLPLIGEVEAGGLTRSALEDAIEEALSRYVNEPQVSVFIREYQSQRLSVIGAVRRPGTYEMLGRKTLLEVISDAGGIDFAEAAGRVVIIRKDHEGAPIEVPLSQLLEAGDPAFNLELEPGDIINVAHKRRFYVYVYGRVRSPGSYELREEITLLQAVSLAGGLAERAAASRVKIVRSLADGTQEVLKVNLQEIVDGEKPDVPVRPNDVIVVPETFF